MFYNTIIITPIGKNGGGARLRVVCNLADMLQVAATFVTLLMFKRISI